MADLEKYSTLIRQKDVSTMKGGVASTRLGSTLCKHKFEAGQVKRPEEGNQSISVHKTPSMRWRKPHKTWPRAEDAMEVKQ